MIDLLSFQKIPKKKINYLLLWMFLDKNSAVLRNSKSSSVGKYPFLATCVFYLHHLYDLVHINFYFNIRLTFF